MNAKRFFLPGTAVLLVAMGVVQTTTALQETQTWDEHIHLTAGYVYWKTGDFKWNLEHPPLVKLVAALPLLALKPEIPYGSEAWRKGEEDNLGVEFLYRNRLPAETLLFAGRGMMILCTLAFGLALALWMRRRFGPAAALVTLAFYCLDPNIIAHGRYVTTDVAFSMMFFFTCAAWARYLESRRPRNLLLAALAFGITLGIKYTSVLLLPVLALLYGIRWMQAPKEFSVLRALRDCAAVGAAGVLAVALIYWPDTVRCATTKVQRLADFADRKVFLEAVLFRVSRWLRLPAHVWPFGLLQVAHHNTLGHQAYLLGMISQMGWWYYFPVVLAVKSTVAALLAGAAVLVVAGRRLASSLRRIPLVWFALAAPPLFYLGTAMAGNLDLGVRHILPVYSFLYAAAGALLVRVRWSRVLVCVLLVVQAAECASIFPYYLAFFNFPSGGPGNGPRYLADSNIDWGQDMLRLRDWLAKYGTNRVVFCYFGRAQMWYYRIQDLKPPEPQDIAAWENLDDFVAVSVTPLVGAYVGRESYAWVRGMTPVAKVGYSIYVYDRRKNR